MQTSYNAPDDFLTSLKLGKNVVLRDAPERIERGVTAMARTQREITLEFAYTVGWVVKHLTSLERRITLPLRTPIWMVSVARFTSRGPPLSPEHPAVLSRGAFIAHSCRRAWKPRKCAAHHSELWTTVPAQRRNRGSVLRRGPSVRPHPVINA